MTKTELKDALKAIDYHYSYSVDFENKTITEYLVSDFEEEPSDCYQEFPYELCGYSDPYGLINSPEWTCFSYRGTVIKDIDGVIE